MSLIFSLLDVNETEEREDDTSPKPKKARRRVEVQKEIQSEIVSRF